MSADVISILHLEKHSGSQIIVVKEINNCDGSFITSCVFGHQIKNKSAVLLITFHKTIAHYQNVGLKLNYNLKKCIDDKLVRVYNVGEEIVNGVIDNKPFQLDAIFSKIKEQITSMLKTNSSASIIFDGISHLFDLQYNLREVNHFVRNVISFVRNYDGMLVLFQCNVIDDDVTYVMSNLLSHMAHTVVEVSSLTTGLSADISGHLVLKYPSEKFKKENMSVIDLKPSCYHFKLFDRGVKLFAPGVS